MLIGSGFESLMFVIVLSITRTVIDTLTHAVYWMTLRVDKSNQRFNAPDTKTEQWNGKPRLACVKGLTSVFKARVRGNC